MNLYIVGTEIELEGTFEDLEGNRADPTFVKASIILPDGSMIDLTQSVTRKDLGEYFISYIPPISGLYQWRMVGYGVVKAANEGSFYGETSFPYDAFIFVPSGSLTLEAAEPVVEQSASIFLEPGTGAMDLVGYIPGTGNPVIEVGTGSMGLEGQPVNVDVFLGVVPGTANMQMVGAPPVLIEGIATQTGALSLVGIAPSLRTAFVIKPTTGGLSIQGNPATLNGLLVIIPNTGQLAFTPAAPQLNTTVTPATGSMGIFAGAAPVLNFGLTLTPLVGAMNFAFGNVFFSTNFKITTGAGGSMAFAGVAGSTSISSPRNVNAGALNFTGVQPVVNFTQSIVPGTGSIVAAGNAPLTAISKMPLVGALAFTGIAPVLIRGTVMVPGVASLILTPIAAALTRKFTITPNTGALSAVGNVPTVTVPAAATWTKVSSAVAQDADGISLAVTAGDLVVLSIFTASDGAGFAFNPLTTGYTWAPILTDSVAGSHSCSQGVYWAKAPATATIDVAYTNPGFTSLSIDSYHCTAGIPGVSIIDGTPVHQAAGATSTDPGGETSGSVTTTTTDALVLSFMYDTNEQPTDQLWTVPGGNGMTDNVAGSQDPGNDGLTWHIAYGQKSVAGAINPTWTAARITDFDSFTVAFKHS